MNSSLVIDIRSLMVHKPPVMCSDYITKWFYLLDGGWRSAEVLTSLYSASRLKTVLKTWKLNKSFSVFT